MLQDVVKGILSIDNALAPMENEFKELQDDDTKQTKKDLSQFISQAVMLYEKGKYEEIQK